MGKSFRVPCSLAAALGLLIAVPGFARAAAWNLTAAERYSSRTGGLALMVWRDGRLEGQSFAKGISERTPLPAYSITKSIVALSCLAAPRTVLSKDVGSGAATRAVTLRQLLNQTSGLAPGYTRLYAKSVPDIRKAAAAVPEESAAGNRFSYGPSHYEMLGNVPEIFPVGRPFPPTLLLKRLGVSAAGWRTDRRGQPYLSAGVVLTPLDLLRLGRFVLERARGSGLFPAVSTERFREAIRGSEANPCYGLGFWLNPNTRSNARERDIEEALRGGLSRADWQATCISRQAPADLICMAGSGGQRVYVFPSLGAVVVRLGQPKGFRDPDFLRALLSTPAAR